MVGESFYFIPTRTLVERGRLRPEAVHCLISYWPFSWLVSHKRNPCRQIVLFRHSDLSATSAIPVSSSCFHRLADITTELMQVILETNALRDKFLRAQPRFAIVDEDCGLQPRVFCI
jgi:hypothetical protein